MSANAFCSCCLTVSWGIPVRETVRESSEPGESTLAHVCGLVGREHCWLRFLDAAFGHLVSVDDEGRDATFANAVAVVMEVELDRRVLALDRLRGLHRVAK
jgi:hypothetical protein